MEGIFCRIKTKLTTIILLIMLLSFTMPILKVEAATTQKVEICVNETKKLELNLSSRHTYSYTKGDKSLVGIETYKMSNGYKGLKIVGKKMKEGSDEEVKIDITMRILFFKIKVKEIKINVEPKINRFLNDEYERTLITNEVFDFRPAVYINPDDDKISKQDDSYKETIQPLLTWKSNNPKIAKVDGNGKVTAVSKGTTTVIARTTDGSNLSTIATITVTEGTTFAETFLKKADETYRYMVSQGYKYGYDGKCPSDSKNVNKTCCAAYVSWVLYNSGWTEIDELEGWRFCDKLKPWCAARFTEITSFDDLKPGDIIFGWMEGSSYGHVTIYAGDEYDKTKKTYLDCYYDGGTNYTDSNGKFVMKSDWGFGAKFCPSKKWTYTRGSYTKSRFVVAYRPIAPEK